jgi:hypothetical protein
VSIAYPQKLVWIILKKKYFMGELLFSQTLDSRFIESRNFYVAFDKLKYYLEQGNEWYDPIELMAYETNLVHRVHELKMKLKTGDYSPHPIEPLPYPKSNSKRENGEKYQRLRPFFKIAIDDQLIWIAIVNIIGPLLDPKMPFWSYGNRLYKPVWIGTQNGTASFETRDYPHGGNKLYNSWNRSWPKYRREIGLTVSAMADPTGFGNGKFPEYVAPNWFDRDLHNESNPFPRYFKKKYFGAGKVSKLFWMGLDFQKFFPNVTKEAIVSNAKTYLLSKKHHKRTDLSDLMIIFNSMLDFSIVLDPSWDSDDLNEKYEYGLSNLETYQGIPTGLAVGGFLANLGLLEIDRVLDKWLEENRKVALLKYVDDQVVIARNKKDLKAFYLFYNELLESSNCGVNFNLNKIEPEGVLDASKEKWSKEFNNDEFTLNPEFPVPLMSHTAKQMSDINSDDYELSNEQELDEMEQGLRQFHAAETTESELKKDTKLSFSALKICQLAKYIQPDFSKLTHKNTPANYDDLKFILNTQDRKSLRTQRDDLNVRYKEIFRLLVNTAKEQPSKIKIWRRCVEFCSITGFNGLPELFKALRKIDLHESSKSYLRAYIYNSLIECLPQAYSIINNEESRVWRIHCSFNFLKDSKAFISKSLSINQPDIIFEIEKSSTRNLSLIYRTLFSEQIEVPRHLRFLGLFYRPIDEVYFYDAGKFDGAHLSYYIEKLSGNLKNTIWERFIDSVDPIDQCAEHLYLMFTSAKYINRIPVWRNDFAWSNQERYIVWQFDSAEKYINLPEFSVFTELKTESHFTLSEWMKWSNSLQGENLDPRITEWTALEIIKQIAVKLERIRKENNTLFKKFAEEHKWHRVHPNNYLIPLEWKDEKHSKSWLSWRSCVQKNAINLKNEEDFIYDPRYIPVENYWGFDPVLFQYSDFPIVIGLSALLAKILSYNAPWPNASNGFTFVQAYSKRINKLISNRMVSSGTKELLKEIVNNKQFDFFFSHRDRIEVDGVDVRSLKLLIVAIEKIQKQLENHQISFNNHSPRQIVPIDLDNLIEF